MPFKSFSLFVYNTMLFCTRLNFNCTSSFILKVFCLHVFLLILAQVFFSSHLFRVLLISHHYSVHLPFHMQIERLTDCDRKVSGFGAVCLAFQKKGLFCGILAIHPRMCEYMPEHAHLHTVCVYSLIKYMIII